ncbi:uncharacterized protein K452DRAFT_311293 [Aplosporella prunicola CBS 121167]|uniref:Glycine cleavage system H protein n=1 Tax=Aplosporella prunicola CBS 121167 TaxID=1176127 RepID=A0A6A6B5Y9_9PEZI|nr:uncharacterized protein K452DRAFT_311293 [Aplosporella prunicola CBS 121167]KAF2138833.1 hypothetical protein K452DRAFT_311293 [Aplosporella prunicola CBS 121167]
MPRARPAGCCPCPQRSTVREKKYTQDHEWVEVSADKKSFTLGISHYAASALGDVVYVELPQTDTSYGAHDAIGAVESVKSASDIMTPLAGTVVAVNTGLEAAPSTINKDPEGEGWIAKIDLEDPTALEGEGLLSKEEYRKLTEE